VDSNQIRADTELLISKMKKNLQLRISKFCSPAKAIFFKYPTHQVGLPGNGYLE
jgi:hypothetical protein